MIQTITCYNFANYETVYGVTIKILPKPTLDAIDDLRSFSRWDTDQTLIAWDPGHGVDHARGTRDTKGRYAFVHLPTGPQVVP